MIRRFTIKGFRRFDRETGFDLSPITVLLGANNSGKSTVLQALNLFQYCLETSRKADGTSKNGAAEIKLASKTVSPDEFGALPVADPTDLWPQGVARKTPIVLSADYEGNTQVTFELSISYNRFSIKPDAKGDIAPVLRNGAIRLIPIFTGFLPREEFLTPPARIDRMRLQRHGEMIRNSLWDIRENAPQQWGKTVDLLQQLFPESNVSVDFNMAVDRFIRAFYHDGVLTRERDIIAAGSGFHQALQILASVLAPGASTILLDEPDAHLHARLQGQLMRIFSEIAQERGMQFVVATHSPHLIGAAPDGSIRVCLEGKVMPFAVGPEQLALLETVGAMDRMEIVPLLSHRTVVFVENKSDRKLLEYFALKLWREKKQREIWSRITFLYTYQHPLSAGVLDLARQVRDLMAAVGVGAGKPFRMLTIGDRDYRPKPERDRVIKETNRKAKSDAYKLEMTLKIWSANEFENYLLNRDAMLSTLDEQAQGKGITAEWKKHRETFLAYLQELIERQRDKTLERVASYIQQADRRLDLTTALDRARKELDAEWGDGASLCDAKKVLSELRNWLSEKRLGLRLAEQDIVEKMNSVPPEVENVLKAIQRITTKGRPSGKGARRQHQ